MVLKYIGFLLKNAESQNMKRFIIRAKYGDEHA